MVFISRLIYRRCCFLFTVGILNSSTIDILSTIILVLEGCPVPYSMCSRNPGLYPLDASKSSTPQPSSDSHKCLQTSPVAPAENLLCYRIVRMKWANLKIRMGEGKQEIYSFGMGNQVEERKVYTSVDKDIDISIY